MKFNFTFFFTFSLLVISLSSCMDDSDNSTPVSNNGSFSSLSFAADDSVANISNTSFTLKVIDNDSVIINEDSITYESDIDDVAATFKFNSSKVMKYVYEDTKDTITLSSGKGTIDFNRPGSIINTSSDGGSTLKYRVQVNIHKVNPAFFRWTLLDSKPDLADDMLFQKLIWADTKLYYFYNNGTSAWAQASTDGTSWGSKTQISNFPVNTTLQNLQYFNGTFFLCDKSHNVYSSTDGFTWTSTPYTDYQFCSFLFTFDNKLWAIVRNTSNENRFATLETTPGAQWVVRGIIPEDFPVYDFASIAYKSRNNIAKALVVGGRTYDGTTQKTTWGTENGVYWVKFSRDNSSLDTLAVGSTLFQYNKKLMLIGYRSDKDSVEFRQSSDEGFSWQVVDSLTRIRVPNYTTQNVYPYHNIVTSFDPRYTATQYPTVAVINPTKFDSICEDPSQTSLRLHANNILLIGGFKNSGTPSKEVWFGKLHKLNFLRQTVK